MRHLPILFAIFFLSACQQGIAPETAAVVHPVRVEAAAEFDFREEVTAVGSVRSRHRAVVAARVPGILEALEVAEGDAVIGGETVLFRIEAETLRRAVTIAEREVGVAEAALRVRQAEVERLAADRHLAQMDHDRFQRLFTQDQAVSRSALEQQESRLAQLVAAGAAAEAAVELAEAQLAQARLAVEIAAKQLADSAVVAPFDAVVSTVFLEVGEMAAPGVPVLRLDDPGRVEITAYLSAAVIDRLVIGETPLEIRAEGRLLATVPIGYRAPSVDRSLRTVEVRAWLEDPPSLLLPGRTVEVTAVLTEQRILGVAADAVLQRRQEQVVFVVEDGSARRVSVRTGLRSGGRVAILSGLDRGAAVVVAGQDRLNDGDVLRVVDEVGP